jgi:hypothetical protein
VWLGARDTFPEESGYAYCTEYVKHSPEKKIDQLPRFYSGIGHYLSNKHGAAVDHQNLCAYKGPYQLLSVTKILRWTMCPSPNSIQNVWGSCLMALSDLRRSDLQVAVEDRRVRLTPGDSTLSNHDCFVGPPYRALRSFDSRKPLPGVCFNLGTYSLRGCFRLPGMPWTSSCRLLDWWTIQRCHLTA